jgi:NhaA family Na+:H+ antiporter
VEFTLGSEASTGALLVLCAGVALGVANSPWANAYHRLWATPIVILGFGHALSLSLRQWINDGLTTVFFLLVGLEIKREVIAGELATLRQAALPIAGAIGGMLVPASIYLLTRSGGVEARGCAIPMATDIAFALGTLALVAPRAPGGLKIFLAALAIVDDMGAVLVIALFYTRQIACLRHRRAASARVDLPPIAGVPCAVRRGDRCLVARALSRDPTRARLARGAH